MIIHSESPSGLCALTPSLEESLRQAAASTRGKPLTFADGRVLCEEHHEYDLWRSAVILHCAAYPQEGCLKLQAQSERKQSPAWLRYILRQLGQPFFSLLRFLRGSRDSLIIDDPRAKESIDDRHLEIESITFNPNAIALNAMNRSLLSVLEHILKLDPEHIGNVRMSLNECFDLFVTECVDFSTSGATKLSGFKFKPSNAFLELVSAIADNTDCEVIFSHDWPILSSGVLGTTRMTEAGGVGNSAPRGGAA